MKVNIPKDWIISKAHLEEGHEIGAGRLPPVTGSGLVSRMLCQKCADADPVLKAAWDLATVATAPDDPIPCSVCGHRYRSGAESRGHIMDCLVPNAKADPRHD